ncbi:hypothetical protein MRX96_020294 [Rhipicephalus microplus]
MSRSCRSQQLIVGSDRSSSDSGEADVSADISGDRGDRGEVTRITSAGKAIEASFECLAQVAASQTTTKNPTLLEPSPPFSGHATRPPERAASALSDGLPIKLNTVRYVAVTIHHRLIWLNDLRTSNRKILGAARSLLASAALDLDLLNTVREYCGLPHTSQVGPTLAEAGQTPILLRVAHRTLNHVLQLKTTRQGSYL